MQKKSVIFWLVAIVLLTGMMAGCGDKETGYLRYALSAEPETIDPRKSTSVAASTVEAQLFEGLTTINEKNQPAPAAAEKWEVSADGAKYTFFLRKNAKWSNGDPVTAQDFEYAWKSALSPELASAYAYQMYYLKNGEAYNNKLASADTVGVRAVDDYTLEVILERPTPYFLSLAAFHTYYPVHRKIVSTDERWSASPKTLVGNGPFILKEWVHNNKMELAPNPQYWDAANVKMDKLELLLLDNASTVVSMFERDQLDMGETMPASEVPRLLREKKAFLYPQLGTDYYSFNVNQAPFDNPKVRKAFQLAVDRDALTVKALQGGQQAAYGLVPPGLSDAKPDQDFRQVGGALLKDHDVETARRLLAEAGYPEGKGLPPVTLLYNTSESHKLVAEAVQEMWKKNLGVQVQLTNQEWKVYVSNLEQYDFQVARDNWLGDYADPITFLELFETGNGNNVPGYSNRAYDRLIQIVRTSNDQSVRMQTMHDAEKILMDDAVLLPLYFHSSPLLVKDKVKGYIRTVFGTVYLKGAYLQQ
ncbi:peptide ABC transporter substrate-binding protein [Acetonema longum]|uniref:Extracellular solute-binding protein family 5 n=1 Tax=Acetonema longum DSM 6540 TaxID=1009370 RepID=F7NMC6_9FIRM|nr:peptide ABC transporter substrate-binding protein [Acetonema longum]EGO62802.1 extracellular solute-binding protein family 5 [Acetonema longum DSM 6540]